jgi:hypothetical protein
VPLALVEKMLDTLRKVTAENILSHESISFCSPGAWEE